MSKSAVDHNLRKRVTALTPEECREAARQEAERLESKRLHAERAEADRIGARRADEKREAAYAAELASVTAALHAQAMGILNIRSLVPVTLDITSPHYNRWCGLVLTTLECYPLDDHVLEDVDFSDDVTWRRLNSTVRSWLYDTVTLELHEVVTNREHDPPTARLIWLGLDQQFIGNRETRAMILDAEFRTVVQGDLGVTEYCRRLKIMIDQLPDLGKPVRDRTLVLNVLYGLNERFAHLVDLI